MTVTENVKHALDTPLTGTVDIVLGTVEHLPQLSALLDEYRVFYGQVSNRPAAGHFLFERIINHESVIYLALDAVTGEGAGFIQLYPSFSSVAMMPEWILNDLYVAPAYRRRKIATTLIKEAIRMVEQRGDKGLRLETLPDNQPAKQLYHSLGFKPNNQFMQYTYQATPQ